MKTMIPIIITLLLSGCITESPVIVDDDDNPGGEDTTTPPPVTSPGTYYYVATDGNDKNPGTLNQPWATWQKAFSKAAAGDTVFIRGGNYLATKEDEFGVFVENKAGTYGAPICIFAFPGEYPVLDCSQMNNSTSQYGILLKKCRYLHLKGLTVTGVKQTTSDVESNGIGIEDSRGIIFEHCVSHGNGGPGFFAFQSDTVYYINCDAYDNFDALSGGYSGGQADGFVACFTPSRGFTLFRGCRSWFNSDDGFDNWQNEGVVVYENCWAFDNGRGDGDGGGFKLGQTIKSPNGQIQRVVKNCSAFGNRFVGFNQNGARVPMALYNNLSYKNDYSGFELSESGSSITVRNNLSVSNGEGDDLSSSLVQDHNNWNTATGVTVNDNDFLNVDMSLATQSRQADGSLPVSDLFRTAPSSDMINAGTDVGLPFLGSAPDLGPYERE